MYNSLEATNSIYNYKFDQVNIYNNTDIGNLGEFIRTRKIRLGSVIGIDSSNTSFHDYHYATRFYVAHFNYYMNLGNNGNGKPDVIYDHMILIPTNHINNFYNTEISGATVQERMNSTSTTGVSQNENNPFYTITQGEEMSGYQGYWGSDMCQIFLANVANDLKNTLGSNHIKDMKLYIPDTLSKELPSVMSPNNYGRMTGGNYHNIPSVILPSEHQILGTNCFGSPFDLCSSSEKLALFNFLNPLHINTWAGFFMSTVVNDKAFACYNAYGIFTGSNAVNYKYIRPLVIIS